MCIRDRIKFYDNDSVELYDLKNDIGESQDIASTMPEKADELSMKLDAWLKQTNASRPQRVK